MFQYLDIQMYQKFLRLSLIQAIDSLSLGGLRCQKSILDPNI